MLRYQRSVLRHGVGARSETPFCKSPRRVPQGSEEVLHRLFRARLESLQACELACKLLFALACHLATICVGTSGASQFLSASLGGREVRGHAAKHKKQTSSPLCACTKPLGKRSKCFMLLD